MKRKPPGRVEVGAAPEVIMMICTAGHVDHGKTSLVKQLTGCNTDRLRVERERGLTIELGFAPCMLRGNLGVGIVDVPGHEKFIRNMVSGVPGIDLAVLVIAADDGIMPQTVEHLQIMELLGVRAGMVALTKIDLVDPTTVARRREEIAAFLQGTFLEGAPICPVSSETFNGYFEFYDTLVEGVQQAVQKRNYGVFRLPVERTFTLQGHGIVLSGLTVDGTVRVGDTVELVPGQHTGRVRGIQVFGRDAESGGYGQCLALNIPDLGKYAPQRGQVLCAPGYLKASRFFHLRVRTVPGMEKPIRNNEEMKFHTGTSEVSARIFPVEGKVIEPGTEGLATLELAEPVAAAALDRFILRRISPAVTVGGGEILAVSHTERRPRRRRVAERLRAYQEFFKGVDPSTEEGVSRKVEYFLCAEKRTGATLAEISVGTLLPPAEVTRILDRLVRNERILALAAGGARIEKEEGAGASGFFVHREAYRDCLNQVEEWIRKAASGRETLSLTVSALRDHFPWPPLLFGRILKDLDQGDLVRVRENKLVLKDAEARFDEADRRVLERILALYEREGFRAPRPDEVPTRVEAPAEQVARLMEHLYNEMKLVRLSKNVVLARERVKWAQDQVVRLIQEKGTVNSADFKYVIDSTRKYALAILDYFDARRVTLCLKNHDRKLAPDFERNLLP